MNIFLELEYLVEIHTGVEEKSDTQAEVYINLIGHRGDTGRRKLLNVEPKEEIKDKKKEETKDKKKEEKKKKKADDQEEIKPFGLGNVCHISKYFVLMFLK